MNSQQQKKKKNGKANSKRRNRNRRTRGAAQNANSIGGQQKHVLELSPCARDYALAVRDPFTGPLACVPATYPPLPSQKVRFWSKGSFATGTLGVGSVSVHPLAGVTNETDSVLATDSTYTGAEVFPSSGTGVTGLRSNSIYGNADFGEGLGKAQYRPVAAGIRVWPICKEIDLAGNYLCFREPDNNSIQDVPEGAILAYEEARRMAVGSSRETVQVTWIPVTPSDVEYSHDINVGAFSLGVGVTGAPDIAFGYEVAWVFELIGSNVRGKSPSHADPAGFAAVLETVQLEGDTWYGRAARAGADLVSKATSALSGLSGEHVVKGARLAYGVYQGYRALRNGPAAVMGMGNRAPALQNKIKSPVKSPSLPVGTKITGSDPIVGSGSNSTALGDQMFAQMMKNGGYTWDPVHGWIHPDPSFPRINVETPTVAREIVIPAGPQMSADQYGDPDPRSPAERVFLGAVSHMAPGSRTSLR